MASTRLPEKMLKKLGGKPVVQHVIERAKMVRNCCQVYVVTDNEEILQLAKNLEVEGLLTSPLCRSGSERISSAMEHIRGDWVFNLQGDEPLVDPTLLEQLIDQVGHSEADVLTPIFKIREVGELFSAATVKVVLDHRGHALYFSRSPIPFLRDYPESEWLDHCIFWGHIGIYGYRRELLQAYAHLQPTPLETAESLEQLRVLAHQYRIATQETTYQHMPIDTADDLRRAQQIIDNGGGVINIPTT
jgi:3-deoxy-manno-octulosonate cytidylyltransferase (CMP-KDO synthetase)